MFLLCNISTQCRISQKMDGQGCDGLWIVIVHFSVVRSDVTEEYNETPHSSIVVSFNDLERSS